MHASLRPEPQLKQRFEFGSRGARGSGWATDWHKAVQGLHELAHATEVPCAGTSVVILAGARKAERKRNGKSFRRWTMIGPIEAPIERGRAVPLGSLRSPSFHRSPTINTLGQERRKATLR